MKMRTFSGPRRVAILAESAPLAAGILLVAIDALIARFSLDGRDPRPMEDILFTGPALVFTLAFLVFPVSGIGWLIAGRRLVGSALLIGRLYVVSWFYGWAVHDEVSTRTILMYVLTMAIACISVVTLANVTWQRTNSVDAVA